jgi:hypothetical protein
MAGESLIDQVLAAQAAAGPPRLGDPRPELTFEQLLISGIYKEVLAERRGISGMRDVERSVRQARRARIPEDEIEAAIAAAAPPAE